MEEKRVKRPRRLKPDQQKERENQNLFPEGGWAWYDPALDPEGLFLKKKSSGYTIFEVLVVIAACGIGIFLISLFVLIITMINHFS